MMEDPDTPDTDLFSLDSAWSEALYLELDCDESSLCPPPVWALPPPPRPPWLSEPEPGQDSCSDSGSEFESCENILILDTGAGIQHTSISRQAARLRATQRSWFATGSAPQRSAAQPATQTRESV